MIFADRIKKLFKKANLPSFTKDIRMETASSVQLASDFVADPFPVPETGTLNVPPFDIEELSYVLECQNRRYCKDLTV